MLFTTALLSKISISTTKTKSVPKLNLRLYEYCAGSIIGYKYQHKSPKISMVRDAGFEHSRYYLMRHTQSVSSLQGKNEQILVKGVAFKAVPGKINYINELITFGKLAGTILVQ